MHAIAEKGEIYQRIVEKLKQSWDPTALTFPSAEEMEKIVTEELRSDHGQ